MNSGERFIHLARLANVNVDCTRVEAPSSLDIGERYHPPLRTTYRRIVQALPEAEKSLPPVCPVKAMNDTLPPEGLVPSALVFGEFPRVAKPSEHTQKRASIDKRADYAQIARKEMESKRATLKHALHHAVPLASDRTYEPGDQVLIWR